MNIHQTWGEEVSLTIKDMILINFGKMSTHGNHSGNHPILDKQGT
jgi:hypothetical protein